MDSAELILRYLIYFYLTVVHGVIKESEFIIWGMGRKMWLVSFLNTIAEGAFLGPLHIFFPLSKIRCQYAQE